MKRICYRKRFNLLFPPSFYTIAVVGRLDILMESKAAGNTGVSSEMVSVCDELLKENVIDKQK